MRTSPSGRRRPLPAAAVLLLLFGTAISTTPARDSKSVFSGLPIDPEAAKAASKAERPIRFEPAWRFAGFSAPLAGDLAVSESLLTGTDVAGRLVALDPKDGRERWRVDLEAPAAVGPALAGDRVLQGTSDGRLHAFAAADGRPLWTAELGAPPSAAPVVIAGTVLQGTRGPELLAIDPDNGTITGRLALESIPLPPVEARVRHGALAAVIAAEEGQVRLVDPASLAVRWRRAVGQSITAPPLVTEDRVYVAAGDRSIRALKLASGRQKWAQRTGSRVTARLLKHDDLLYALCYDNDIYIFGAGNGHLRARVTLDHRLAQDAALAGDRVFVAPYTAAAVVGLELPALAIAGRFELDEQGEWFTTPPAWAGDRVALGWGRESGRLISLDVRDAPPPERAGPEPEKRDAGPKSDADKPGPDGEPTDKLPATAEPDLVPPRPPPPPRGDPLD